MARFRRGLCTILLTALTMGSFLFPVAWADVDSDSDGMPDSFENQYLGEVMFEDHFDDGILDPAWVMKLTYWEEVDGKLKTVPEVLPGFNYGHGRNGRSPLIVLHEGDPTWTDYSYEFTCSSLGVVPELNPYGLPIGFRGGINSGFRVQEQPESWNEPANYLYSFSVQVANEAELTTGIGDWRFAGSDGTYIPGNGWSPNYEGTRYTFTEGNSPAINPDSQQNHVNILVKENKMYAWVNGVFIGDTVDPLNFSPYGGISFRTSWEAMAWYDDVIVRSVGLNPNVPDAHLDYDNDGFTNLEEYQNDTNPMVPECEHATYSFENNKSKLTIPFIDVPLLDPNTHQFSDEFGVFQAEFRSKTGFFADYGIVPNRLKFVSFIHVIDACHAVYSYENKTLSIPFVDFGSEVYEATLKHLQEVPLDLGVFRLKHYEYLYTLD